jgi:hypothetical protein
MDIQKMVLDKLDQIEKLVTIYKLMQKPVLNFNEASAYLEVSPSHLYKLTAKKMIPHFCPNNKKLYFKRLELDDWLLRNKQFSIEETQIKTEAFLTKKGLS